MSRFQPWGFVFVTLVGCSSAPPPHEIGPETTSEQPPAPKSAASPPPSAPAFVKCAFWCGETPERKDCASHVPTAECTDEFHDKHFKTPKCKDNSSYSRLDDASCP